MSTYGKCRVALTGACGFLGAFADEKLRASGAEVLKINFRDFLAGENRIAVRQILERSDVICHLAGVHPHQEDARSKGGFWQANQRGTEMLLASVPEGCRLVFASSAMAAGAKTSAATNSLLGAYAGSKRAAEALVEGYVGSSGAGISLRLRSLAGAHRVPCAGLVGKALQAAISGSTMYIYQEAAPREYLHIEDAATAVAAACLVPYKGYHVADIGSGVSHSVQDVVAIAEVVTGKDISQEFVGSRGDFPPESSDLSVAAELLKWHPRNTDLFKVVSDQFADLDRFEKSSAKNVIQLS